MLCAMLVNLVGMLVLCVGMLITAPLECGHVGCGLMNSSSGVVCANEVGLASWRICWCPGTGSMIAKRYVAGAIQAIGSVLGEL